MNKKTQIFTRWQDPTVDEYKDALENAGTEIILLRDENKHLKSIIKEIDDYCVKTNGTDRKKGDLDLDYNYICGWNAGKDEVCTQISFILDKENNK